MEATGEQVVVVDWFMQYSSVFTTCEWTKELTSAVVSKQVFTSITFLFLDKTYTFIEIISYIEFRPIVQNSHFYLILHKSGFYVQKLTLQYWIINWSQAGLISYS